MDHRYSRRQAARGSRPDATDDGSSWYLLKMVSHMRLTYQIKLLTFAAAESGALLIIRVPRACHVSDSLRDFLSAHKARVKLERVD
ncbi:hypothetical protein Rhe02_74070 [Rhizocola hellebori]|uniref:Uncharacterized protein n=1 Tax=Rhizocola hellebori TaxID=1392758 RepID=A0A8J3VK32_9ACTN|nr:hypothetical protein [Rhizocola hellebori]GIH09340.1 hypothetical protein Rhe02_74070 [Rhizocola hellebori]